MRKEVVRLLKPLHAISVENGVSAGTPDVNCTLGWIELKSLAKPAKDDTVVECRHFTAQQKLWLRQRWAYYGGAWVLIKIGGCWLLFDGPTAAKEIGNRTFNELKKLSCMSWNGIPTSEGLIKALRVCWPDQEE